LKNAHSGQPKPNLNIYQHFNSLANAVGPLCLSVFHIISYHIISYLICSNCKTNLLCNTKASRTTRHVVH